MKNQIQKAIWGLVFWSIALPTFAQILELQLELVKNINASVNPSNKSKPQNPIIINNTLYFTASDGLSGNELWKTEDGTDSNTMMVKDINPGVLDSDPSHFVEYKGELYFVAENDETGRELWKSDGTEQGTVLVKDIYQGALSSNPHNFLVYNGLLYFAATDPSYGAELWRTNGTTEEGTVVVKNLLAEGDDNLPRSSFPSSLVVSNDVLFFTTLEGNNNFELWQSDGTEPGTKLFVTRELEVRPQLSSLTDVDGVLFFQAKVGSSYQLWKSDGSDEGTKMVKALKSPALSLKAFNGMLIFVLQTVNNDGKLHELWQSNGEAAGTLIIENINSTGYAFLDNLTVMDDRLFFIADDNNSRGLWAFNGTEVQFVKSIDADTSSELPVWLIEINNNEVAFFAKNAEQWAWALWRSDGTTEGTKIIHGVNYLVGQTNQWMRVVGGTTFYFTMANDAGDSAEKLWKIETNAAPNAVIDSVPTYQCTGNSTQVTLNGGQSLDVEDASLILEWRGSFGLAVGEEITVSLAAGQREVELTVIDSRGHSDAESTTVTVEDNVPPVVEVNKSVVILVAESDRGALYNIKATVSDQCSGIGLYQLTSTPTIPHNLETSSEGVVATAIYPLGETVVELSVEDQLGNQTVSKININVVEPGDPLAPSAGAAPGSLDGGNTVVNGIAVADNGGGALHPLIFLFFIIYRLCQWNQTGKAPLMKSDLK